MRKLLFLLILLSMASLWTAPALSGLVTVSLNLLTDNGNTLPPGKITASHVMLKRLFIISLLAETGGKIRANECKDEEGKMNYFCYDYQLIHMSREDLEALDHSVTAFSGAPILASMEKLPGTNFLPKYSTAGLRKLFEKLYASPQTTYSGTPLQAIYDSAMKDWMRRHAAETRRTLRNRALFQRSVAEYSRLAHSDPEFSGTQQSFRMAKDYGCRYLDEKTFRMVAGESCDERWMSMLVRRQLDGTLPVVLEIMNRVLKDYDPEEYRKGPVG